MKISQAVTLRSLATGAASGIAAAWAMNRFQALLDTAGFRPARAGLPSNWKAADELSQQLTGERLPQENKAAGGAAVHYAFGAFLGAVYHTVGRGFPVIRSLFGTAYGAVVALTADEIAVPLTGLGPKPREVSAKVHAYGIVSHLVFGAAIEGASRLLMRREAIRR